MGLDVYLAKSDDWDESLRIMAISEKLEDTLFKEEPEGLSDGELRAWRADKIAAEALAHGLKVGGDDVSFFKTGITHFSAQDSSKYPDHLFKVGYFRSSYNGGGLNTVLGNLGIHDLYDIFQIADSSDYYQPTDWQQALTRVDAALTDCRPIAESGLGFVNLKQERRLAAGEAEISAASAISLTLNELSSAQKMPEMFRSYGNRHGTFHLDGLHVVGIFTDWLIYKLPEPNLWYLHALEIVRETIELVLSQPRPENWRLCWSA